VIEREKGATWPKVDSPEYYAKFNKPVPQVETAHDRVERRLREASSRTRSNRPAWAASPSFATCYSGLEMLGSKDFANRKACATTLAAMREARVVTVESSQVEALPELFDDALVDADTQRDGYWTINSRLKNLILPFTSVFLDMDKTSLEPRTVDALRGVLCFSGAFTFTEDQSIKCMMVPFVSAPELPGLSIPGHIICSSEESIGVGIMPLADWGAEHDGPQIAVEGAERAVAVFDWLQSVNVEMVEAPLSSSQQRKAERKGRKVALTVRVKQNKRRVSNPSGGERDYSHRFEVSGHYKHHFEEKPNGEPNKIFEKYANKNPDKVLNIQGQRCVRFWTPPFVKGPEDKPLVPKIRVMEAA
jgi:hypothetical protein